jgi:hypothetical protein
MNLFANNTSREAIKQPAPPEPYVARRAVRYTAADNAQAALQRQFPGMSFGSTAPIAVEAAPAPIEPAMPIEQAMPAEPVFVEQPPVTMSQNPIDATLAGARDEFTQAA